MTASYAISVRQASDLLTASFRFHLTVNTLAVQLVIPLTGLTEDSHLQVILPAPPEQEQRPSRRYAPCLAHPTKKPLIRAAFLRVSKLPTCFFTECFTDVG